ncbi:MAG TPA: helix-turn-helix transcriptional regulator, partial [Clostridia bacterium]|nr:helix-turn-helix transcriptional regulator [Clostridia bacterium]
LTEEERAVCKRLRQARHFFGLSQAAFAEQIGISRDSLASYEVERAPVPFEVAVLAQFKFKLSFKWLATGEGHVTQDYDNLPVELLLRPPSDMPFATAYSLHLKEALERELERKTREHQQASTLSAARAKRARAALVNMASFWADSLSNTDVEEFLNFIWAVGESYRTNRSETVLHWARRSGSKAPSDPMELFRFRQPRSKRSS